MSDEEQEIKPHLVPVASESKPNESSIQESFSDTVREFVPVITTYLDHQATISEKQTSIQLQQLELSKLQAKGNLEFAKDRLQFEKSKQSQSFMLSLLFVGPIIIVALGSAAGLIFLKNNVQAGVFLLTHLVAAALGILGGMGWQKSKQEPPHKQ